MSTAVGDRIELLEMPNDPCPIPTGSRGTVTRVTPEQIWVDWDDNRSLMLLPGIDKWRKI